MQLKFGNFRLGLRTIKTALTLVVIMLIMELLGRGDSASMIAGVSAIVVLRDSLKDTLRAAPARLLGQAIGGGFAIFYFLIYEGTGFQFWIKLVSIATFALLIIVIMDGFDMNPGLVGATATFLMVALSVHTGSAFIYTINRVLDSFIGVMIAIAVNSLWIHDSPFKKRKEASETAARVASDKTGKAEEDHGDDESD